MECFLIEIESQGQTMIENYSKEEEFYFMLEGEVILFLNKKQHYITKGDGFYLLTNKEYYLFNYSFQKSKILKVVNCSMRKKNIN